VIREHEYGRYGNPTQQECERKLAAVEGAERAVLFASGMSAVILTIMTFMRRDGHIIFTSDCYRQTRDFAANLLAEFGIQVSMPTHRRGDRKAIRRIRTSSSLNHPRIPICGAWTSKRW